MSMVCSMSNPPTFPTQPPPQQLPWSSPYQHVPLSIAPSTLATNQPYAQYCPSMSTPNIMGTNQFQPSRQPQLLTQQLLNTGQAYTDQEQSLIQTNFSHGSGSQPNFSGASSSNASLTGLDRMDTCTMFDQNTSNL
uniref:Uncharacterized protein n=1 Tax=Acrobeloides nanus TaxID=290746 RepID=A0A914D2K4_9BILA